MSLTICQDIWLEVEHQARRYDDGRHARRKWRPDYVVLQELKQPSSCDCLAWPAAPISGQVLVKSSDITNTFRLDCYSCVEAVPRAAPAKKHARMGMATRSSEYLFEVVLELHIGQQLCHSKHCGNEIVGGLVRIVSEGPAECTHRLVRSRLGPPSTRSSL